MRFRKLTRRLKSLYATSPPYHWFSQSRLPTPYPTSLPLLSTAAYLENDHERAVVLTAFERSYCDNFGARTLLEKREDGWVHFKPTTMDRTQIAAIIAKNR